MNKLKAIFLCTVVAASSAQAGPLHDAARSGDAARVRQLLAEGANANEVDPGRGTPLQQAIVGQHDEVVALLVAAGADIGARDALLGLTPLHFAALAGDVVAGTLLLDKGAPVDARSNLGSTPLYVAAEHGRGRFVALLIARGADVNAHNDAGDPPIHAANAAGHFDIGDALRHNGAVAPPVEPISGLLAAADPTLGEGVFNGRGLCNLCHTVEKGGRDKTGPNLWDVLGRDKAGSRTFQYSPAFSRLAGPWTYEEVNALLASAHDFVPGTKMEARVADVADRAAIIGYLRQNSDAPPPLPASP